MSSRAVAVDDHERASQPELPGRAHRTAAHDAERGACKRRGRRFGRQQPARPPQRWLGQRPVAVVDHVRRALKRPQCLLEGRWLLDAPCLLARAPPVASQTRATCTANCSSWIPPIGRVGTWRRSARSSSARASARYSPCRHAPLRIMAAGEVPQAARPDLSDLAAHVHDDERVGVPPTQPTVLAPRASERSLIEAIAVLTDRSPGQPTVAMVEDRCQLPSLGAARCSTTNVCRSGSSLRLVQAESGPCRACSRVDPGDRSALADRRALPRGSETGAPERSLRLSYPVCELRFTSLLLAGG